MDCKVVGSIDMSFLHHLPIEICDLIFDQLKGSDLLRISEVSTYFFHFIACSQKCMSKIKIKLSKSNTANEKILLIESPRRYENLEIQHSSLIETAKEILSVSGRKWKLIVMKHVDFETFAHMIEFLKIFENDVQELYMEQIYDKSRSAGVSADLKFPNLKRLEAVCCQALLFVEAFINCQNITSFKIKSGNRIPSHALEAVKGIIEKNINLNSLEISYNIFNLIFEKEMSSRIQFHLKEFHANDLYKTPGDLCVQVHLLAFLRTQGNSLETLTISEWFGIDVIKMALSMPRLKSLTLKGLHNAEKTIDWEKVELRQNFSVTKLAFHDLSNNNEVLKKVINLLPELQSLKLFTMDQNSMELVSANCQNLKSLYVDHFLPSFVSSKKLFKNLHLVSIKNISNLLNN